LDDNMCGQITLDGIVPDIDYVDTDEVDDGVPSAHNPEIKFYPRFDGKQWICDGPNGACEHFRYYNTPCRHILQKRFENVKNLYEHICKRIKQYRDRRDEDCQDFDDVIAIVAAYKTDEMNKLATLMLNIAVMHGQVTTDDLHDATCEAYADNKIVGVVTGALLRNKYIEYAGRIKTTRKCAHGRSIGIYKITEDGFEFLRQNRLESDITEKGGN